jgi:hypothetical protein
MYSSHVSIRPLSVDVKSNKATKTNPAANQWALWLLLQEAARCSARPVAGTSRQQIDACPTKAAGVQKHLQLSTGV